MEPISLSEARRRLLELLDKGARGEDILITHGDGATYRIAVQVVDAKEPHRQADLHAGLIEIAEDFDKELPEYFWFGNEESA